MVKTVECEPTVDDVDGSCGQPTDLKCNFVTATTLNNEAYTTLPSCVDSCDETHSCSHNGYHDVSERCIAAHQCRAVSFAQNRDGSGTQCYHSKYYSKAVQNKEFSLVHGHSGECWTKHWAGYLMGFSHRTSNAN